MTRLFSVKIWDDFSCVICSTLNCQLRSEKDVLSVKVNLDVLRNYGQLCK